MTMKPLNTIRPVANVTVAISTRERPDALATCLDALLAGDVLPAEIVVVDQSRDARTRQVVASRHAGPVLLRYIHHDGHGLAASQNIAITRADCTLVAVTDDDCVPAPSWMAAIERAFASPDGVDVLTGRVLPLGPPMPGLFAISSRISTVPREFDGKAMPWEIGSGNNFVAKRAWLMRVGGNDERLGPGTSGQSGVDMDLFYRLLRAGARIRYEPALLVYHARTTMAGRLSRRIPYGYGMGVCCMLWLRQGDRNALRVLAHWVRMRLRRLVSAPIYRHWLLPFEELLVLSGTVGGLVHGLRARNGSS